jgi:hypothetical protein
MAAQVVLCVELRMRPDRRSGARRRILTQRLRSDATASSHRYWCRVNFEPTEGAFQFQKETLCQLCLITGPQLAAQRSAARLGFPRQ